MGDRTKRTKCAWCGRPCGLDHFRVVVQPRVRFDACGDHRDDAVELLQALDAFNGVQARRSAAQDPSGLGRTWTRWWATNIDWLHERVADLEDLDEERAAAAAQEGEA